MKRYRTITIAGTPEPTNYAEMLEDTIEDATFNAQQHIRDIEHQLIDIRYNEPNHTKEVQLTNTLNDWNRLIETMNSLRDGEQ